MINKDINQEIIHYIFYMVFTIFFSNICYYYIEIVKFMSANVAYVWTNISWIYLLYSCILVNRMNKSVICIYKGTHACSIFTACLIIMSTCRIFMLSCQILLSELWQHSKYIYVTVIFPTVNNQIRLFFFL